MAFSKLKAHLRRMKARTFDTLFEAVAEACELFPQKRMSELLQGCGVCGTLNGWRSSVVQTDPFGTLHSRHGIKTVKLRSTSENNPPRAYRVQRITRLSGAIG
jgi:hypothetical protein